MRLSTIFWSVFIGLALLFAGINAAYYLLKEKSKEVSPSAVEISKKLPKEKLKEKFFQLLEENNRELLRRAWEKSLPEVERLKRENLQKVKTEVDKLTEEFFSKLLKGGKVDRFLDWFYSLKTEYFLTYLKAKDLVTGGNATETYIEEVFYKTVVSPKDLEVFVKVEVLPVLEKNYEEFQGEVLEILKKRYREEVENFAARRFGNSTELREWLKDYLNLHSEELNKALLEKVNYRIAVNTVGVAGGYLIYKVIAKVGPKLAAKVAAKVAEKFGLKIATALSGAESGGLACLWLGPFDVVCAVGGAIAATFATDYAVNRADKYLTEGETKRELLKALEDLKTSLRRSLLSAYERNLNNFENRLSEEFSKKLPVGELGK